MKVKVENLEYESSGFFKLLANRLLDLLESFGQISAEPCMQVNGVAVPLDMIIYCFDCDGHVKMLTSHRAGDFAKHDVNRIKVASALLEAAGRSDLAHLIDPTPKGA